MKLHQAKFIAEEKLIEIAPYCEASVIAGSVRRQRAVVNDVDIVCIPRTSEVKDLLGDVTSVRNLLHEFLTREHGGTWVVGEGLLPDACQFSIQLLTTKMDLFLATKATWWTRLICRTGSQDHNIFISQRARSLGMKWRSLTGLEKDGQILPVSSEEEFYDLLQMPFLKPTERDLPIFANIVHRYEQQQKQKTEREPVHAK